MKKINIIIDRLSEKEILLEKKIFGQNYNVIGIGTNNYSIKDYDNLKEAKGIIAWHEINYNKKILSKLKNCKIIVRAGVGFDNVDVTYAKKNNILVSTIPDYGINDVADHAITLLLILIKRINFYQDDLMYNNIWSWRQANKIHRISKYNLGILGLGRIGLSTFKRAQAFGFNVSFFDPYLKRGVEKIHNIKRYDDIKDFLRNIDALSIHVPLNNETKNMVNYNFLKNLKKNSILINTARGKVVNTNDVFRLLKENHLNYFATDVLEEEPPNNRNKLFKAWKNNENWIKNRVIITPHCAPFNRESYQELRTKAALEVKNFIETKKTKYSIF